MPAPTEPKQLRRKQVAKEHAEPPVPPVRTENAVPKRESLVMIAAIPGNEELHPVGVSDKRAGQQNDLRHFIDVLRRDHVLQFENRARRQQQRQHHREPAEDCACHEVRRKNSRVPRRYNGRREVE